MKPVKNKILPCFKVGGTYIYREEDVDSDEFEVEYLQACQECGTCSQSRRCDCMTAIDTTGRPWCGIYDDFEEVI